MKKFIALLLAAIMIFALAACGADTKTADNSTVNNDIPEGKAIPDNAVLDVVVLSHASWPYEEGWKTWEYIKESIGGTINVTPYPSSDWATKFPLIMASPEDFPDLYAFMSTPKYSYCEQGAFLPLDDYAEYMPDYVEFCENLPEDQKWLVETRRAPDGKIYFSPIIGMEREKNIRSWLYRKDIFDKHNLKVPETFDEIYEVSKELKKLYPESYPFCMRTGLNNINVIGSSWKPGFYYNVYYDFENGEFRYGATEDVMFEIVEFFHKMVSEKLIPENYFTINASAWQELVTTNRGFIMPEYQVRIDFFNSLARANNPEFNLTAMKPPVANSETGLPMVNKYNNDPTGYVMFNTKDEERIVNSARYINWFYTDEACELLSWGKEGETYEVVNGEKKFILDEHASGETATTLYGFKTIGTYTRLDPESLAQTVSEEQYATTDMSLEHTYPHLNPAGWMQLTSEESDQVADLNTSITSFVTENLEKFILGQRPLTEWDNFRAELSELPIEELLAIYENAYAKVK